MTEGRLAPEEVRTRTFTRVVRGYRRREVRRLLERAATDLARLRNGPAGAGPYEPPPLTPEEVEEARFQPALGGYEMNEVDQFLDRLIVELERAAREPPRAPSALPAPPPSLSRLSSLRPLSAQPARRPTAAPPPTVHPAARPAVPQPPRVTGPPPGPVAPSQAPPAGASDEALLPPPSVPPSSAPAPSPPAPPTSPGREAPAPSPLSTRPLTPSEVETRTFDPGTPGYLPAHVDLFLARAARALAGREGDESLTRWDVLRQRFPLGPRGYTTSEVDAFLVRLAAQFPDPDPAAQQEILRKLQGG
jgi:DivIVA domain-containing protein